MPDFDFSEFSTQPSGYSYSPPALQSTYLETNYAPHYNEWKADPNPKTTGNMLRLVDPIINEALRTYGGNSATSPTLKSKAKNLTISALNTYDPSKAKLRTHLLSQLQGLRRISAKEEQIIKIPEQVMLDAGNLREAENRLRDQLARDPSDMELADYTGLSTKRLSYLRGIKPSYSEGRLTQVDEEGTSIGMPAVEQHVQSKALKAWHDYVYHDLDPVDQLIMEHTLGLHKKQKLSNQELATKLRLSPGAISQRKSRIQQKLDLYTETGIF